MGSFRTYGTLFGVVVLFASCTDQASSPTSLREIQQSVINRPGVRVYRSPYAAVNWKRDQTVLAQHHDHFGTNAKMLQDYDAAGYNVVTFMDYSGVASLPYAWTERHWPVENWLPNKALSGLRNVKLLVPGGEEVGYRHITSSFMAQFIAQWEPAYYPSRQPWHYASDQESINLINRYGGAPIIAHPWYEDSVRLNGLIGMAGMEVYSGYVTAKWNDGTFASDLNTVMLKNWDRALMRNQSLLGIGVNDHFGPGNSDVPPNLRDSGKILVWVPSLNAANYQAAFRAGALVAIKDVGRAKNKLPRLASVVLTDTTLVLAVTGPYTAVKWIANRTVAGAGLVLNLQTLPENTVYARAEISNAEGSVVYTQAFTLRRFGDANGDGLVDTADQVVCAAVAAGTDRLPEHVDACR
jgi:hypothetical protein